MFVQIIEGRVTDRDALRRRFDLWAADLRPAAEGFLGSTGGITADGRAIVMARFASAEAAAANSARPEQGAWWADTEVCFDGSPTFAESTDVDLFLKGGDDSAAFVQVMKVPDADRVRTAELDELLETEMTTIRPEVMGGLRAWTGPNRYVEAVYFTSEAAARAGEAKELPHKLQEAFAEVGAMMESAEYLDLTDPWIRS
jgi:hypothetical protein